MRHAHRAGLRTTATMMYGTVETLEERLEHLLRLRELQDETGGFTAFITWSYQPDHTELAGAEATGVDYLRTLAIARLVLDNFDNLQASWVTQGGKVGQLSLAFGANDMGRVMIEENVVRAAGASYCMDEVGDRPQHRGCRVRRQAPRTCTTRSSASPIFREHDGPAHDGRWRRRARATSAGMAGRAGELSGAKPRRQGAATSSGIDHAIRARWVLPDRVAAHHANGWVAVDDGRVDAVGREPAVGRRAAGVGAPTSISDAWRCCRASSTRTPTSNCRICAERCRPPRDSRDWIRAVMASRREQPDPRSRRHPRSAAQARSQRCASGGTALVGDISNTLVSVRLLRDAGWPPPCSTS